MYKKFALYIALTFSLLTSFAQLGLSIFDINNQLPSNQVYFGLRQIYAKGSIKDSLKSLNRNYFNKNIGFVIGTSSRVFRKYNFYQIGTEFGYSKYDEDELDKPKFGNITNTIILNDSLFAKFYQFHLNITQRFYYLNKKRIAAYFENQFGIGGNGIKLKFHEKSTNNTEILKRSRVVNIYPNFQIGLGFTYKITKTILIENKWNFMYANGKYGLANNTQQKTINNITYEVPIAIEGKLRYNYWNFVIVKVF